MKQSAISTTRTGTSRIGVMRAAHAAAIIERTNLQFELQLRGFRRASELINLNTTTVTAGAAKTNKRNISRLGGPKSRLR